MGKTITVRYIVFGRSATSDPPAESGVVEVLPLTGTEVQLDCGPCVVVSIDGSVSPVLIHCRLKGATTPER